MSDEISYPNTAPTVSHAVTQTGDKNYYFENIQALYLTLPHRGGTDICRQPGAPVPTLSLEYYHLFVSDEINFHLSRSFTMQHKESLKKYMSPELIQKYCTLSDSAMQELLTFPCLFANLNKFYGRTSEDQYAELGFIREIQVTSTGIKIYPQMLQNSPLSQQRLNESLQLLGISGHELYNEFNETHWCIKSGNLTDVLNKAGFRIYE